MSKLIALSRPFFLVALGAAFGIGCTGMPPCTPGQNCSVPAPNWRGPEKQVQYDQAWIVWYGQNAFNALPAATQSQAQAAFQQQVSSVSTADTTYMAAVNANPAQDATAAIAPLIAATTNYLAYFDQFTAPGGPANDYAKEQLSDAKNNLADMQNQH
jgi:hypothetical protein